MKKATKKDMILSLIKEGKSPKEIAKKIGVPVQTVYTTRWAAKKPKAVTVSTKRRGRPRKPVSLTVQANALNKANQMLSRVLLEDKVDALNIEIANLKHQIIGFRAVISYLEDLAGVRDSQ